MHQLVLGTAQLGQRYGIANTDGVPDEERVRDIIRAAWEGGIREFDTSSDYGESETVLARALKSLGVTKEARILDKLPTNLDYMDGSLLREAVSAMRMRLNGASIACLWIRRKPLFAFWDKGLREIAHDLVESGAVESVGVSVYDPDESLRALELEGIDAVQVPTNIVDRRFEQCGFFGKAAEAAKKVYIRSIFLQGLLLMRPEELSEKMSFARPVLETMQRFEQEWKIPRVALLFRWVLKRYLTISVLFGAETPEQVRQNLQAINTNVPDELFRMIDQAFSETDERLVNPALWPK